jgi:hypothetical protein
LSLVGSWEFCIGGEWDFWVTQVVLLGFGGMGGVCRGG